MRSVMGTLLAAIGGILIGGSKEKFGFAFQTKADGTTEQWMTFQPGQYWWIYVAVGLVLILVGLLLTSQRAPRILKQSIPLDKNPEHH